MFLYNYKGSAHVQSLFCLKGMIFMSEIVSSTVIWWISCVDIPVIGAGLMVLMRFRREMDGKNAIIEEKLADFKLEVAKNYASLLDLKDTEARLIAHLLRIEAKLDQTALKTAAMQRNNG